MKSNKTSTLINISSLGSATLINAILAFIVGILTRNILGPDQYGIWVTISLIFTFSPLFHLGILNAMNREVPFYQAKNDEERVSKIRGSVFTYIIIISVLTTFIFLMLSFSTYFTEVRIEYKIGFFLATAILLLKFFSM